MEEVTLPPDRPLCGFDNEICPEDNSGNSSYLLRFSLFRPPVTLVPGGLIFHRRCFFLFAGLPPSSLADRRETSPHDRNTSVLYNASPKIRGALPQRNWGPKHAKFGAISDNFKLRSRISPERVKISKIGKRTFPEEFLLHSTKKAVNLVH